MEIGRGVRVEQVGNDIKLIQGNCIKKMKDFSDNSVDLVLTSPPYNMNPRIRNGKYCSRQIVKEISTKYKNFDDNLTMDDYFSFNKSIINECLRISDLVFYNVQILTGNKPALFRLMGEFHSKIKEFIVWDKCMAQPAIGKNILNSQFEILMVLQNINPESRLFKTGQFPRGTLSNLWKIKRGKKISPLIGATFPEELAERVIKSFTFKKSTIMDPFMGTGTTGVICKKLKRRFIGIEIDQDYFEISKKRISETDQERG